MILTQNGAFWTLQFSLNAAESTTCEFWELKIEIRDFQRFQRAAEFCCGALFCATVGCFSGSGGINANA